MRAESALNSLAMSLPELPSQVMSRYEDLGVLGQGGMAEVRRVHDRLLGRTVAMKVIHRELLAKPELLSRFVEEAQCAAQLQHPGLVPVHDLGRLPNGNWYFTMDEVRGRTLAAVLAELRQAGDEAPWKSRRLIDAFHRVCEAMSYAHSRGVVHRDLKPHNIMLGEHGEVLVLDWGLARVLGTAEVWGGEEPVVTERVLSGDATRVGAVAGTPAYMPPEQARGEAVGPAADVYSLGAILYEILDGRPLYEGEDGQEILGRVRAGASPRLAELARRAGADGEPGPRSGATLPPELVSAAVRALARDPRDRFTNAGELAQPIAAWLDGASRRERALELLRRAEATMPQADELRELAADLRDRAEQLLRSVAIWQPEGDKVSAWALQDRATAMERQAGLKALEREQLLHAALAQASDLVEARRALAWLYRANHAAAEASGDADAASRAEQLLRATARALPLRDEERGSHLAWLRGDGALTLRTVPPGAEVSLYAYEKHNRRLIPRRVSVLGKTPLEGVSLPMGRYLCVLRLEGFAEVRYPVRIGRQQHWDGVPPEQSASRPVPIPPREAMGPDDCYVPAGWAQLGGDPDAPVCFPSFRTWVPGFIMRRYPVTNAEYIEFLDSLVLAGREEDALRFVPRERGGRPADVGGVLYGRAPDGRFLLEADPDGDVWDPEWPVIMVDHAGASAYARWLSERDGLPWRLPGELEVEKAARGVDGRRFPWGDFGDPSWSCNMGCHPGRPLPVDVRAFPIDESPYGVRGLGGNVRTWCADWLPPDAVGCAPFAPPVDLGAQSARWAVRGGMWDAGLREARSANRSSLEAVYRGANLGFRLVRPI